MPPTSTTPGAGQPPVASPVPGLPTATPTQPPAAQPPAVPPGAQPPATPPETPPARTTPPGGTPTGTAPTPAQVILTAGTEFRVGGGPYTVPISVNNASRISTITLSITYNATLLRVRTATEGTFMRQGGVTASFTPRMQNGRVDIAITRAGDQTGASGSGGLLAALVFDALAPGSATIDRAVAMAPDGHLPVHISRDSRVGVSMPNAACRMPKTCECRECPPACVVAPRRSRSAGAWTQTREGGFTFVELLVVCTILLILASAVMPLARVSIQRQREAELRRSLREMRTAIDKFKDAADAGAISLFDIKAGSENYPATLEILADGVTKANDATGVKLKFLRRIPMDPMTHSNEWGMRAYSDRPDSTSWGGSSVFDVYTKSEGKALDGTKYKDW